MRRLFTLMCSFTHKEALAHALFILDELVAPSLSKQNYLAVYQNW